jgi:hypothetical protein
MDLDRLILARDLMNQVADKCRSNSKLPELVELFLSRPLVTVPLGAKILKVTPKAVHAGAAGRPPSEGAHGPCSLPCLGHCLIPEA